MAIVEVIYEPWHINDPGDLAAWTQPSDPSIPYDGAVFDGAILGAHVGGDDALADGDDATYVALKLHNPYADNGPSEVATFRLRPTSPVPEGAVLTLTDGTARSRVQEDGSGPPTDADVTPWRPDGTQVQPASRLPVDTDFLVISPSGMHFSGYVALQELSVVATYDVPDPPDPPTPTPTPLLRQRQIRPLRQRQVIHPLRQRQIIP